MSGPTIRPARDDAVEALLRIQREAAVAAFRHIFPPERHPFPDSAIRKEWQAALGDPEIEVDVAELDAELVGSASVGHGYLRTLYVLPANWCTGIGSTLHDHALERLRSMDVTEPRLWTLVDNAPARRFYERRGWVLTGETRSVPFPPHPLDVEYVRPLDPNG
jgi:GNAT superfamily N-acetyltransferase